MNLRDINIKDIESAFNSKDDFIAKLDRASKKQVGCNKNLLISMLIYYMNLFNREYSMEVEVYNNKNLAIEHIEMLYNMCDYHECEVVRFLIKRIEANLKYVEKIRRLT